MEFSCLRGQIEFKDVKPVSGLVKLGRHRDDYMLRSKSIINLATPQSVIVFHGRCSIGDNFLIRVYGGRLDIGDMVWIGSNVSFMCFNHISIGKFSSITFNCKLIDSTCHYILDTKLNTTKKLTGEVLVGSRNWVCNNSTLMKGFKTGNNCIVASNSLCNKNYVMDGEADELLIGGIPANVIRKNVRRIFSYKAECRISELLDGGEKEDIPFVGIEEDEEDLIVFFR